MITPDEWKSRGATFEWQGQRVFYRIEGKGEPLLLVHGFPTASWDWWAVWPALVAKYRCLTLDMMGFGFSAKPIGFPYSIFAQADLYEALLAREGVTSYRMLAHDYGDTVAQELLARDLERAEPRIASIALLNGGLFPETHQPLLIQRLLLGPLGPLVTRLTSKRALTRSMQRIFGAATQPSPATLDTFWRLVTHDDGLANFHLLIRYMSERCEHRERWVGALVHARCPLAVIDGAADPISGAHMVARYREVVGKGTVVELRDIGHYPQVEAPEAVLQHYLRFVDEVEPR